MMISEVCHDIKNYFCYERIFGKFKIEGGVLRFLDADSAVPSNLGLQEGQYFRIANSVFNDGVWKYSSEGIEDLQDETFNGGVWLMKVPRDFLQLVADIEAWQEKYGGLDSAAQSPFSSESFGGYSYSKASGGGSGTGTAVTWKENFASRLNRWRKI